MLRHGLKVKTSKYEFAKQEVALLGHVVNRNGICVDPQKVDFICRTPRPKNQTEFRIFLGIAGYYHRFFRSFSSIAASLYAATSAKADFAWAPEMEDAFRILKSSLTSSPVLAIPDFDKSFAVETDASAVALGAVL